MTKAKIKTFKSIPEDQEIRIAFPLAMAMLTGVSLMKQDNTGAITLVYQDHSQETANNSEFDLTKGCNEEEIYKIVDFVQEKRDAKNG